MKYSKLILSLVVSFIAIGLLITACDNRIVDPLDYTITSMNSDVTVIYSDGDEMTYATIQVMVKDSDNFAVFGQEVQFKSNIGYLTPAEAITDSSGLATVKFHDGNSFGMATIEAIVGSVSESIEIYVDGVPPQDVSSIGFDVSEQVQISVQGTGGMETFELVASLYDSSGQLITQPKNVLFELLYAPDGTNINNIGLSDSTYSIAGKASVNINSGGHSGIVTCRVSTRTLEGALISSSKSNIVVASGFTHTVEFGIGGHSSGTDMGSGMWKVQISALLNDIEGNPVAAGTAVYFSLPEEPEWASVVAAAYVNNLNAMGDSLAGVAYSYLNYNGSHTNDAVAVRIETGLGDIFEGELILPLQFPTIDIAAVPIHIDWWGPTPADQSTEIRLTVKDGQNNPIDNQEVLFSSTLGQPQQPSPPDTGDPYTGLTGIVNGEHGRLDKEVEFNILECPEPIPSPPGTTTGVVTAQILGTNTSNQVTIILRRY
ncbi:MAG: Ig-like domain-containing protein [Candidatus Tenebribacter davisii]|nr:Ig-like domain-containing protein [Candidatus Tenebribacter davisii]